MSVLESFIIQYFYGSVMKYWVAADAVRSRMDTVWVCQWPLFFALVGQGRQFCFHAVMEVVQLLRCSQKRGLVCSLAPTAVTLFWNFIIPFIPSWSLFPPHFASLSLHQSHPCWDNNPPQLHFPHVLHGPRCATSAPKIGISDAVP